MEDLDIWMEKMSFNPSKDTNMPVLKPGTDEIRTLARRLKVSRPAVETQSLKKSSKTVNCDKDGRVVKFFFSPK